MKLEIKALGQRNPPWSSKKLGFSSSTIGQEGCNLVCHTMLWNFLGKNIDPSSLNDLYKTAGVFKRENLIDFWRAPEAFPGIIKADEFIDCANVATPIAKIDDYLAKGMPVIALVDFSPTTGVQTHFVLIIGRADQ